MHSKPALLLAAVTFFSTASAAPECNTFLTNGSTAATYQYYRFYDFRNLHESAGVDAASASASKDGYAVTSSSNGQSKIVSAAPWDSGWDARDWYRPASKEDTLDMQYTPSRVSISKSLSFPATASYLLLNSEQRRLTPRPYVPHAAHYPSIKRDPASRRAGLYRVQRHLCLPPHVSPCPRGKRRYRRLFHIPQ
jgi:hypothetical protein